MGARGPAKGHGGRPRKKGGSPHKSGYVRATTGPKGRGRQDYKHRVVAGAKPGDGRTVDHKDGNKKNNSRSNLQKMSRAANTAKGNRRRGR